MIILRSKSKGTQGFTIIELMLATSVFSIVLLAALASFLQVGHLFYKGVSLTNTQNVATTVLNDLTNGLQTSNTFVLPTTQNGYTYWCIGNTRYTYTTHSYSGQQVSNPVMPGPADYSSGTGTFGLLKDSLPGSSGCGVPCASGCGNDGFDKTSPVEMLGEQMRVADVSIQQSNPTVAKNLYNIKIVMAYGEDTVLDFSTPGQPECTGNSANQAFCSVVNLSTTVFAGTRS